MSDSASQQRLADVCRATLTALSADGAAATVITQSGTTLAHATDETADLLDQEQRICGEGPAFAAFSLQTPVIVDDLRGEQSRRTWPLLADAIDRMQVGQVVVLPVGVGGIRLGVLSIYKRSPGELLPGQLPTALLAADTVGLAMLDAEGEPDLAPLSEIGPVLDYRIHQATGMVMGQTGGSALDALTLLRARAFRSSVPLQQLATDVIDRRARFDLEAP